LNRKTKIKEVLDKLVVMEETIKLEKKQSNQQNANKHIKNPCKLHNGTHEWADCRQNPKNNGNGDSQEKNGQEQKRGGNNNGNNRNREESRNTETGNDRNNNRNRRDETDDEEYESNQLIT
jgi:hypothetical protein